MKDIVDSSEGLPVVPASEVQAIGSLPYLPHDGKGANEPVVQFPGALQSQLPSI